MERAKILIDAGLDYDATAFTALVRGRILKAIAAVHGISRHRVPADDGASSWIPTLGWALAIGSAYFLAARLGLALLSAPSDVAVFWPASGVAAGILITFGRRARAAVVIHPTHSWLSFSPGCVELPLLFWLAARYPPALAIVAAFVLSILVICATVLGIGHFGDATIPIIERVQGAQLTVAMVMALTLVLVALFAERRQKEAALQLALEDANLGAFSADLTLSLIHI